MSNKEIKKYDIVKKLINKEINGTETARILNITVRHVRRLKQRVKNYGIKGLIHKNRGKKGNRKMPKEEKEKIKKLLHKKYYDFGPTLASEKLEENHGIKRDPKTIRTILIEEKLWKPKQKKKTKHRSWRQRKAAYGEMIQYDGSYEYWFGDKNQKYCLLASIDDANSKIWIKFDKHEGVKTTFNFWKEYVKRFGKPYSIYVDRFSTYSMNSKLAKENPDTLTQFQRVMETELNIKVIHAKSAEGKGRVERLFKTLQDRLIKELRLNNISTMEDANNFLEKEFIPKFNDKFMVEPRLKNNFHKKLSKQEINKLDLIFSRQYTRIVGNDFTIAYKKTWYQLTKNQAVTICKKDKIIVEKRMDDSIHFKLRGKYLNYEILPERPKKINSKKNNINWVIPKTKSHKPNKNHPWRKISKAEYLKKITKNTQVGHF